MKPIILVLLALSLAVPILFPPGAYVTGSGVPYQSVPFLKPMFWDNTPRVVFWEWRLAETCAIAAVIALAIWLAKPRKRTGATVVREAGRRQIFPKLPKLTYTNAIATLILFCLLWIAVELHSLADFTRMSDIRGDRAALDKLPLVQVWGVSRDVSIDWPYSLDVEVTNVSDIASETASLVVDELR